MAKFSTYVTRIYNFMTMQGIDENRHQSMVKAIAKFEQYSTFSPIIISDNDEEIIMQNIAEFKGTHDYYRILLIELEVCIKNYKGLHESLQKKMYPCIRKMNSEIRRKRGI